eukprot:Clim_evm21s99 gene=Clim_evmTU21s99
MVITMDLLAERLLYLGSLVAPSIYGRRWLAVHAHLLLKSRADHLHGETLEWLASNRHIQFGYRRPMTAAECVRHAFSLHNEFVNIVSHVLGSLFFGFMALYYSYKQEESTDLWAYLTVAALAHAFVYAASSFYHIFQPACTTKEMYTLCLQIDQYGCIVGVSISGLVLFLISHRCTDPLISWAMGTLFAVSTVYTVYCGMTTVSDDKVAHKRLVRIIGGHFALRLVLGYVPLLRKWHDLGDGTSFIIHTYSTLCLVIGIFIMENQIPECWLPGKFDIYGASHQIWHFFSLSAGVISFIGFMQDARDWHLTEC